MQTKFSSFDSFIIIFLFIITHILLSFGIQAYGITSILFIMAYGYYFLNYKLFRKMAFSFPMKVWLLLTLYHWINAMNKHVPGVDIIDLLHGFRIYACMVLVCFWASVDLKRTLQTLITAFIITLCIFILQAGSFDLRFANTTAWATEIGQRAAVLSALIVFYSTIRNRGLVNTILWLLIPLAFVIISQTRNALGMMAIMFIGYLYVYIYKSGRIVRLSRFIKVLFFGSIFLFAFSIYFVNTSLSTRFSESTSYRESYYYQHNVENTNATLEQVTGDRLSYYINGWRFFRQNPWTGIGMWNYGYMLGGEYPLHSEYMIHLSEGGIIGATLWIIFIIYVIYKLFKLKKNERLKWISLFAVLMLLFCGIYAREFYYEFFYPIYGIALYLIYAEQKEKLRTKRRKLHT